MLKSEKISLVSRIHNSYFISPNLKILILKMGGGITSRLLSFQCLSSTPLKGCE